MYAKEIFEQAMASCGYSIDKVVQDSNSQIRKIEGRVKIPKK